MLKWGGRSGEKLPETRGEEQEVCAREAALGRGRRQQSQRNTGRGWKRVVGHGAPC